MNQKKSNSKEKDVFEDYPVRVPEDEETNLSTEAEIFKDFGEPGSATKASLLEKQKSIIQDQEEDISNQINQELRNAEQEEEKSKEKEDEYTLP